MNLIYLGLLTFSLVGVTLIDFRYKLALFFQPLRTLATLAIGVLFFLLWDVTGIALGVFFKGESELLSGVLLATELPLEELLFLLLLCHCSLLLFLGFGRRAAKA